MMHCNRYYSPDSEMPWNSKYLVYLEAGERRPGTLPQDPEGEGGAAALGRLGVRAYLPTGSEESDEAADSGREADESVEDWARRLEDLKGKIQEPVEVTEEDKKKHEKKTEKEVFKGDAERMKHYNEQIREAIETLDAYKLWEFIMSHKGYEQGDWKMHWNEDFESVLDPEIDAKYREGISEETHSVYVVSATQRYLIDFFGNDVFQIKQEKPNFFIKTDGKMGAYTVSVLAEYWERKYGSKQPDRELRKNKPDPDRSTLSDEYAEINKNRELYTKAINHLELQVGEKAAPKAKETSDKKTSGTGRSAEKTSAGEEKESEGTFADRYRKLDQAGEIEFSDGEIKFENDYKYLSLAIADYFDEDVKTSKNPKDAPKTYRILRLLAEKYGEIIDNTPVFAGYSLSIKEGKFTMKFENGSELFEVKAGVDKEKVAARKEAVGKAMKKFSQQSDPEGPILTYGLRFERIDTDLISDIDWSNATTAEVKAIHWSATLGNGREILLGVNISNPDIWMVRYAEDKMNETMACSAKEVGAKIEEFKRNSHPEEGIPSDNETDEAVDEDKVARRKEKVNKIMGSLNRNAQLNNGFNMGPGFDFEPWDNNNISDADWSNAQASQRKTYWWKADYKGGDVFLGINVAEPHEIYGEVEKGGGKETEVLGTGEIDADKIKNYIVRRKQQIDNKKS
jgi:hypothetical protein